MAVMASGAQAVDSVDVLGRAVPLVGLPAVSRMTCREPIHQIVTNGLGNHGCGGNRMAARVAVHDRFVFAANLGAWQAIDEYPGRREAQPAQRALHGEDRSAPDVESVDLSDARRADGDRKRALANL